ncbi:hypothetical protein SDC9_112444 [bioreactor metagenome]|uniref:Uncharacterized protein n=1 Tax=bioreactor metagenome TaxID=1076179 RepID=A0A645BJM2_9ZZZZ
MPLNHQIVFGVFHSFPVFNHTFKLFNAVHFDTSINGISRLIDHIPLATLLVVLHARSLINTDAFRSAYQSGPIVRHRPAPFIHVLCRFYVSKIVQNYTGKSLSNGKRDFCKLYRPIIPKLNFNTDPMHVRRIATLCGFIVNPNQDFTLGTANLHGGAFTGKHRFPIVRLADIHTALRVIDNLPDI